MEHEKTKRTRAWAQSWRRGARLPPCLPHGGRLSGLGNAVPICFTGAVSLFHALLLGVVEGFTEFLPISSTAHLILASRLLGLTQTDFQKTFEIVIQLGAILAVLVLYWRSFLLDRAALARIATAILPTAVIGLLLQKIIKDILFESLPIILWSLFLGGVLLVLFERTHRESHTDVHDMARISYKQAFLIGCFQALAVVPGVSRSAATIVGGQFVGVGRKAIVDFSFVLAVPVMFAAAGLDLAKSTHHFSLGELGLLMAGFTVAFLVALLSIRWLLGYIKDHSFAAFGACRMLIALAFSLTLLF